MFRQIPGNALLAMGLFSGAALLMAVSQSDGERLVGALIAFPLLVPLASIATIIAYLFAALGASLVGRSAFAAAAISAGLGWLFASGGYQSFGGLGAYSDFIQPAFAIALATPWLIQGLRIARSNRTPKSK